MPRAVTAKKASDPQRSEERERNAAKSNVPVNARFRGSRDAAASNVRRAWIEPATGPAPWLPCGASIAMKAGGLPGLTVLSRGASRL